MFFRVFLGALLAFSVNAEAAEVHDRAFYSESFYRQLERKFSEEDFQKMSRTDLLEELATHQFLIETVSRDLQNAKRVIERDGSESFTFSATSRVLYYTAAGGLIYGAWHGKSLLLEKFMASRPADSKYALPKDVDFKGLRIMRWNKIKRGSAAAAAATVAFAIVNSVSNIDEVIKLGDGDREDLFDILDRLKTEKETLEKTLRTH